MSRKMAKKETKKARKGQNKQATRQRKKPEKYKAMRQIEIYCKACDCYIRKYQLCKHKNSHAY